MSRCIRIAAKELGVSAPRLRCFRPAQRSTSLCELWRRSPDGASRLHSTSATDGFGSSVSALEVSHFTKLASSWWDPHGPSRLLHLMNPLRHEFIRTCLASAPTVHVDAAKKFTYLDIGCGGGIFAASAARLPTTANVTAIDPTSEVIKVAKSHQRTDPLLSEPGRLNYLNCAIEELGSQNDEKVQQEFDFVSIFEVIEHIDRPAAFLRQALAHVKPGGWLIGSTIARHPMSYLTTKVVAEAPWPIGVVPAGTHDWNKYINPDEIQAWFAKENVTASTAATTMNEEAMQDNFGNVRIEGCVYLPLAGWKWIQGSEKFGNYFFGAQKLR